MKRLFLIMGVLIFALSAHAVEVGKYAVILERKPFGEPPPETAEQPVQPPQPQGPPLSDQYKLNAMKETEDGIWIGFIDIKTSKSYYLKMGESEDGVEVVDADYDLEKALLRKDGREGWITMGGTRGGSSAVMPSGVGFPQLSSGDQSGNGKTNRLSYAERRRKRLEELEERRRRMAQVPQMSPEEMQKKMEEYQMELIRSRGEKGPPLPMPLTPEMDAQLVAEGVLPPLEEDAGNQPVPQENQ